MIKKTILYFAVLFLLITGVGHVMKLAALRFDPNEPKVDRILKMQGQDYDMLFMGNSVTLQAINPVFLDSLLGIHSYNFAVGGASIIESKVFLQHYLMHNAKPELVVLGLFINEEAWSDRLRPTIELGVEHSVRKEYYHYLRQHKIDPEYSMKFYNRFAIFRHRNVIEHVLKYIVEPKERQYRFQQGYLYTSASNKIPDELLPHESGINENGLLAFDEFCRQQGIRVLYIEPPNNTVYNTTTENRDGTLQKVRDIVGLGFISFNNDDPMYTLDDWFGLNHFNIKGARKFTGQFVSYVRNEYPHLAERNAGQVRPVSMVK